DMLDLAVEPYRLHDVTLDPSLDALDLRRRDPVAAHELRHDLDGPVLGAAVRMRLVRLLRREDPVDAQPCGNSLGHPARAADHPRPAVLMVIEQLSIAGVAELGKQRAGHR